VGQQAGQVAPYALPDPPKPVAVDRHDRCGSGDCSLCSNRRAVDRSRASRRQAAVAAQRRATRADLYAGELADQLGSGHAYRELHTDPQEALVRPQTRHPTRGHLQALPRTAEAGAADRDARTAGGANRDEGEPSAAEEGRAAYAHDREGLNDQALRKQAANRLHRGKGGDRRSAQARARIGGRVEGPEQS